MRLHRATMKGKITNPAKPQEMRKLTPKMIDANKGFLGTEGRLLKRLIAEKLKENLRK
jgi:hypothetical protein